jgi:type III secretory pathway component EscR
VILCETNTQGNIKIELFFNNQYLQLKNVFFTIKKTYKFFLITKFDCKWQIFFNKKTQKPKKKGTLQNEQNNLSCFEPIIVPSFILMNGNLW